MPRKKKYFTYRIFESQICNVALYLQNKKSIKKLNILSKFQLLLVKYHSCVLLCLKIILTF